MERDNADDYRIVREALEKVQYGRLCPAHVFRTLSGGEQQRVILARALAQQTQCLILDEPTNHLDIKYQLQLMDIVRSLRLTVVSAIHDLNIAAMYCNKLFVLQNGRIIAFGPPKQVLTREFIRQVYEVEAKLYTDPETGQMHILYESAG